MTLDTICSAGLTAFHLACQNLTLGECDMAILAAVNMLLGPSPFVGFSQAKMLSPRGILAPFDESADGFVRAKDWRALALSRKDCPFLPPLRRIYAQVMDWGVNAAGKTESLTMPSSGRQGQLLQKLIQNAKIPAENIVYVEAHGTGTKVGDPIESSAISAAVVGQRQQILVIGFVKGHTGHLETAARIVGAIEANLCLHHRKLVPTTGHHRWPTTIDGDHPSWYGYWHLNRNRSLFQHLVSRRAWLLIIFGVKRSKAFTSKAFNPLTPLIPIKSIT